MGAVCPSETRPISTLIWPSVRLAESNLRNWRRSIGNWVAKQKACDRMAVPRVRVAKAIVRKGLCGASWPLVPLQPMRHLSTSNTRASVITVAGYYVML